MKIFTPAYIDKLTEQRKRLSRFFLAEITYRNPEEF